ncbi:MAG: MBL fold metallo-hydrolase [Akkermansiaceae bacterium]|jgi:hydroxyacylglutathione hydrolase
MNLHIYTGGYVETNGFILELENKECIVIDAPAGITGFLREKSLIPKHLLLTHQHFDHVEDCSLLEEAGAQISAWAAYAPDVIMEKRVQEMGIPVNIPPYQVHTVLEGQTTSEVAGLHFDLAHVPGHSPESVSFHLVAKAMLFAGDALFNGSIGRTDLPGGNHEQLLDSIRKNLYTLPDETAVFPGHGPQTKIGREKASNPFCPQN